MLSFQHIIANVSGAVADGASHGILETFGVKWELVVAQIINFCVVAYILYRFALKPILKTVDERQKKISDGLQYAEEIKTQLSEIEKQRADILRKAQGEAQQLFEKTKKDSEAYFASQKAIAEENSTKILRQAEEAISSERRNMLAEAKAEVGELVVKTAERLLFGFLKDSDKAELNKQAFESLEKSVNDEEAL